MSWDVPHSDQKSKQNGSKANGETKTEEHWNRERTDAQHLTVLLLPVRDRFGAEQGQAIGSERNLRSGRKSRHRDRRSP